MAICFLDPKQERRLREGINSDPEFKLAAEFMTQDVLLGADDSRCLIKVRDGVVTEIKVSPTFLEPWGFAIRASAQFWEKFLQPVPPPFHNGLFAGMTHGILKIEGNLEAAFAHFWAMCRMLDVMRQLQNE